MLKFINLKFNIPLKSFRAAVSLAAMLLAVSFYGDVNAAAAEYKLGPGDSYDAEGNIVALDGTIVVRADGTVVEDAFKSGSGYTVLGNGSGETNGVPREIIAGVDTGTAAGNTALKVANELASKAGTTGNEAQSTAAGAQGTSAGSISNNNIVTGSGADAVYSFEGKKYKKGTLYGTQKLTGYSADETGTAATYSGKTARVCHTVAAPSNIPIGTVIIVEGKSGPYASRYNGVYVVEDRGGYTLESQGLIDIFCASQAESSAVTAAGWNFADIYIAEAVQ